MNYQHGLNRAFFVFCVVWVFFVLVGVPVVVSNQVLQEILSREREAAKMADLSLMAGESTKYYDEQVKVQAQEYAKWSSFPYFYKKLWGEGRRSNAFCVFSRIRKISTASLVTFNTHYVDDTPVDDTPYVDSGRSRFRLVGNVIINVYSSWGSARNAGNPTVDHPWL